MRLLQLCSDPGIAFDGTKGASVHMRSIHRALRRAGHDVSTIVAKGAGDAAADLGSVAAARGLDATLAVVESAGIPDVVYERYSLGSTVGLQLARRLGRPLVLEVNAPLVQEALRHRPTTVDAEADSIETRLFREADAIVTVSEPLRRYVSQKRGSERDVRVVRNGCDPQDFPRPADVARAEATLVFLGHPKPWHGADRLLGILGRVVAEGFDARLVVVGGGDGASALSARATDVGLARRVTVTGALSEAEARMRLCDGVVSLAPYEPPEFFYFCPMKVIESMAAGLCVVASDVGDIPAIAGDCAWLVDPASDAAFARAVVELLANPARRRALGSAARDRALRELTWDASAAATVGLIDGVLAGGLHRCD